MPANSLKIKTKAQMVAHNYLKKEILTYEKVFEEVQYTNEPTDNSDNIDIDKLLNHLPFYMEMISQTQRQPKKIIVNDIGPALGYLEQGHEQFYRLLFDEGANIFHCKMVNNKPVLTKLKNYEELADTFKKSTIVSNTVTKESLKSLGMEIESYEYIDHDRRLEIFNKIHTLLPETKIGLAELEEIKAINIDDKNWQEQYWITKKIKSLKLPSSGIHYILSKKIVNKAPNQAEKIEINLQALRNETDEKNLSSYIDYAMESNPKEVTLMHMGEDPMRQVICEKLLKMKEVESLHLVNPHIVEIDFFIKLKTLNSALRTLTLSRIGFMDGVNSEILSDKLTSLSFSNCSNITRFIPVNLQNQKARYTFPNLETLSFICTILEPNYYLPITNILMMLGDHPHIKKFTVRGYSRRDSDVNIKDLIAALPILSITELDIGGSLTSEETALLMQKCPNLQKIIGSGQEFSLDDFITLRPAPQLTSFTFGSGKGISTDSLNTFLHLNPKLKTLALVTEVREGNGNIKCPEHLNIEDLSIRDFNFAYNTKIATLRPLFQACSSSLKSLILDQNTPDTMDSISLPNLEKLAFNVYIKDDADNQKVNSFSHLICALLAESNKIEELELINKNPIITKTQAAFINNYNVLKLSKIFGNLRTLKIHGLTVEVLSRIALLRKTPELKRLTYACPEITPPGWDFSAYQEFVHSLQPYLNLDYLHLELLENELKGSFLHLLNDVKHLLVNSNQAAGLIGNSPRWPSLESLLVKNFIIKCNSLSEFVTTHKHLLLYGVINDSPLESQREVVHKIYINELELQKITKDTNFIYSRKDPAPYSNLTGTSNITHFVTQNLHNRAELKLDSNTYENFSNLSATTYFDAPATPAEYRLSVATETKIVNGNVQFIQPVFKPENATPIKFGQLSTKALVKNYQKLKQNNPNIRLGGATIDINPGEWRPLPSCAAVEKLQYVNRDDIDIVYDKTVLRYYFKLKDNIKSPQKINLRFIEEIEINKFDSNRTLKPNEIENYYLSRFNQLVFNNDGLIKNEFYHELNKLQKHEIIKLFYLYIAGFPIEASPLIGHFTSDVEILNALFQQKKGACRHRAKLFAACMNEFGINCRTIENDIHAFNEITFKDPQGNDIHYKFDHRGYPSVVSASQNTLLDYEEPELEKAASTSTANSNNQDAPLISTESIMAFNSENFDNFLSKQLDQVRLLPENHRNILIAVEDDDVSSFHAALLQYYQKSNQKMFFVPNLDAILDHSGFIIDGKAVSMPSPLASFVTTAQENDALITNWSNYNSMHLAHNNIMDDDRQIGATPIPRGVVNIGIIKRSELNRLGEDLTSRFRLYSSCPSKLLTSVICEEAPSLEELTDNQVIIPFYNDYWRSNLIGRIGFNQGVMQFQQGKLIDAIQNNKTEVIFQNAPWHLEDFQQFYNELIINKSFVANGVTHQLPNNMVIKKSNEPFKLALNNVNVDYLTPVNYSYVLNKETLSSFIQGYSIENRKLQQNNGIFELYATFDLNLYVTDSLTHNQWAWLLSEAKRHQCRLHLHIDKSVMVPNEISEIYERQISEFTHFRHTETVINDPDINNQIRVIETPDLEAAESYINNLFGKENIVSVHEKSTFSELMGHMEKDSVEDEFTYNFIYSDIYKKLKRGETVVLKGNLSEKTRQQLESLFIPDPYLYINGSKHYLDGKLILLTGTPNAIPFIESHKITVTRPEMWHELSTYLSDINLFNYFYQKCNEFEKISHYNFSFSQLKTMLQQLESGNLNNPFAAFFRLLPDDKLQLAKDKSIWNRLKPKKTPAITSDDFFAKRKAKFERQLKASPYIFIVGSSGAGKSTFLLETLKDDPAREIHMGMDKMLEWANASGDKQQILFLDEANLEYPGFWENLEGIFDVPPGVIIKNKYYPLLENHKIVFAGNYQSFEGRHSHRIFEKHGNIITFKDLPDFVLRERVILPALIKLFPNSALNHHEIMNIFILMYNKVNTEINDTKPLTPRNIKTMCLRFKLYTEKYHQHFSGEDSIKKMAAMAAYDEISTSLTKEERIKLKDALHTEHLLSTAERKNIKGKLKLDNASSINMVVTKTRKNPLRLMKDGLALRKMKMDNPDLNDLYAPGIMFEGGSGIGKSALVYSLLQDLKFALATKDNLTNPNRYYILKPGKREAMRKQLQRAFHEGAVMVINEFNSIGLEKEINTILSGTDFDGKPASQPGFYIIATQNPVSMKKRPKLSEALLKRFQKVDLKDYSRDELIEVVTKLCRDSKFAVQAVDDYLKIRLNEERNDVVFKSAPRTLFDKADDHRKSSKRELDETKSKTNPSKRPKTAH